MKDPTKLEMYRASIQISRTLCDGHDHRWVSIEGAIWWFANDHYSGMFSNLYQVLSASRYSPAMATRSIEDEPEEIREIYQYLISTFIQP